MIIFLVQYLKCEVIIYYSVKLLRDSLFITKQGSNLILLIYPLSRISAPQLPFLINPIMSFHI